MLRSPALPKTFVTIVLLLTTAASTRAQAIDSSPDPGAARPIGVIDFYGLHRVSVEQLRQQLTFKVGDLITFGDDSFFAPSEKRLKRVPGVSRARAQVVCCTDERPVVFIGIEEPQSPVLRYRPAPRGSIRLPPGMLKTGAEFDQLREQAVLGGHAEEDYSEGHALLSDVAAEATEERMIAFANNDRGRLRKVLRDSADPEHRALAAQLLGYAKDLQSVVPDLVYAMSDSSEQVRNNAMRALMVFTQATKVKAPRVPYKPFIALLNSPVWTDRNKSSITLMQMASTRDPRLLEMLRKQALPSLIEMARWGDRGHASPGFWILGYVAGLDDKTIADDWEKNDSKRVIEQALGRQIEPRSM